MRRSCVVVGQADRRTEEEQIMGQCNGWKAEEEGRNIEEGQEESEREGQKDDYRKREELMKGNMIMKE